MFDNNEGDGRFTDTGHSDNEVIIQNLLEDFQVQREAMNKMILDIEELKTNIDKLFPKTLDARYTKFFEEKVKTAVAMFNVLLDVRKELLKTTKDEIELRRKVSGKGDLNDLIDVRKIAKSLEKYDKTKDKLQDKAGKLIKITEEVK